jgi:hypothetical protein
MNPILRLGVSIVLLALASYTVGVVAEQRAGRVSRKALAFLVTGVILDVTATVCMIIASERWLTLHGGLGYSALAAMVAETILAYRHRIRFGDAPVAPWLHVYTRVAYAWWVVAFISGGLLVALGR